MCSDMGIKPQEIGSLDLLSYVTVALKCLSRRGVLINEKSIGDRFIITTGMSCCLAHTVAF